jgi:hypothetical protein
VANAAQQRTLIGRDAELDRVEEFLAAIDSGPGRRRFSAVRAVAAWLRLRRM